MDSALRQRRLMFYRSILRMVGSLRDADSDIPALLLGEAPNGVEPQLDVNGTPLLTANPWLCRFHDEIQQAVSCHACPPLPASVFD